MITSTNPFLMDLYPQGYALVAEIYNDYYRRCYYVHLPTWQHAQETDLRILEMIQYEIGLFAGTISDILATDKVYWQGVTLAKTQHEIGEEIARLQWQKRDDHRTCGKEHDAYYDARIAEYRAFLEKTQPLQAVVV